MKKVEFIQMSQLVDMKNLPAVLEEVKNNFIHHYPVESFPVVRSLFNKLHRYCSENPSDGLGCPLDFSQAGGIMLAFSRIFDGYNIENGVVCEEAVILGLIASILCSQGVYSYLEEAENRSEPAIHIEEMKKSVQEVFDKYEITKENFETVKKMITCACINYDLKDVTFDSEAEKTVALMVASADILGRMSSRNYLEKLLNYYDSVKEDIDEFSRLMLLKQNIQYYRNVITKRLEDDLMGLYKLCEVHFERRYDIGYNMYIEAIDRQIEYLEDVLQQGPESYRAHFKRSP